MLRAIQHKRCVALDLEQARSEVAPHEKAGAADLPVEEGTGELVVALLGEGV